MKLRSFVMAINDIDWLLDRRWLQYDKELDIRFRKSWRSLCIYLGGRACRAKIDTLGFNQICIDLRSTARYCDPKTYFSNPNNLHAEVYGDLAEFAALPNQPEPVNEYMIGLLQQGLAICAREHEFQHDLVLSFIDDFRDDNYVNEWVFKARAFRDHKLRVRLMARLDIDVFNMTMIVWHGSKEVFRTVVLTTGPDEIFFMREFKDIILQDNKIILIDPIWEKEVWSVGLDEFDM